MMVATALLCSVFAADWVSLQSGELLRADRVFVRAGSVVLAVGAGEIVLPPAAVVAVEPITDAKGEPPAEPVAATPPPRAEPPSPAELVRGAARRYGLPPEFVESVARAESALNPRALSPKGALGLMQLMPQTAQALGVDPIDPAQNADGGARLLRQLLLEYQSEPDQVRRALAAYNAGSGAVKRYNGVPPYRETQTYVERVLRQYRAAQKNLGH